MNKNIIIILALIELQACKTILLKRENFFDAPVFKVRLIESDNYKPTNLNYKVNYIEVADSIKIETWVISTQHPENCFFFFAPSSNSIANSGDFMERLAIRTNSKVIGIQYRGFNYSDGNPDFDTCFKDNDIIYSYYKKDFLKYISVNFIGISIGTVFAPKLASYHSNEIDNIILMSAFSTPQMMLKEIKRTNIPKIARPFVKLKADDKLYSLNNIKSLKSYNNGLLVIQAKDDKETGYNMAVELIDSSMSIKKELVTLKDGGHFAPFSKKYADKIIDKINIFIK